MSLSAKVEENLGLNPCYDTLHLTRRTVKFLRNLFYCVSVYETTASNRTFLVAVDVLVYDSLNVGVSVVTHFDFTLPVPLHVGHFL